MLSIKIVFYEVYELDLFFLNKIPPLSWILKDVDNSIHCSNIANYREFVKFSGYLNLKERSYPQFS